MKQLGGLWNVPLALLVRVGWTWTAVTAFAPSPSSNRILSTPGCCALLNRQSFRLGSHQRDKKDQRRGELGDNDDDHNNDACLPHDTTENDRGNIDGRGAMQVQLPSSSARTDPPRNNIDRTDNDDHDALLEYSIDSFLRGDYDRPFEDDAVAPLPGLSPGATVEQALRALRTLDDPEPSHGAACFLRFCVPLRRGERWSPPPASSSSSDASATSAAAWKELLRGSLTPTMFARRLRASRDFSPLLDWTKMDVTEGAVTGKEDFCLEDSVAFVNAAFYFDRDDNDKNKSSNNNGKNTFNEATTAPELLQIKLSRVGGVWLIESIQRIPKSLFQNRAVPSDEGDKPRPSKRKRRIKS